MDWLQLQAFSIPPLTQGLLSLVALGAVLRTRNKTRTTWLFVACFAAFAAFYASVFLQVSVMGTGHYLFIPLIQMTTLVGLTVVMHLAYTFRGMPFRTEGRWIVRLFAGLTVLAFVYVVYELMRYGPEHTIHYTPLYAMYLMGMAWVLVVCLRRIRLDHAVDTRWSLRTDTQRAFAFLGGLTFLSAISGLDGDAYMSLIVELLYLSGFVLIYVNYSGERISVQVKLVTLTLATLLGVLGIAGLVLYTPEPFTTFQLADGSFDLDHYGAYRQEMHSEVIKLAYVIFGSTAFVLVTFPLLFGRSLIRPLQTLLAGVRDIQAGNLNTRVSSTSHDEWSTLTTRFNAMAASLDKAQAQLRTYTDDLERLVDTRTREIVQQKEIAEHARAVIEEQAEALKSLDEAKSHFFANLSHEFRTPLTLIVGPIQDVLDEAYGPVTDDLRAQLTRTQTNAFRLLRLINQLLDLSKLETGHMELQRQTSDVVAFVKGVLLSFASLAEQRDLTLHLKHVPASANDEAAPLLLSFDRDKLEQVLTNLISNAFKFTPDGGRIRVTVESGLTKEQPAVSITVRDSGQGIPATERAHIFDRFYQGSVSPSFTQRGTGIGLALTRELVELHGGSISVTSEEGFGSVFTVVLPQDDAWANEGMGEWENGRAEERENGRMGEWENGRAEESKNGRAKERENEGVKGSNTQTQEYFNTSTPKSTNERFTVGKHSNTPSLLLVEDDPDVRAYIRESLEPLYRVREAADGKAALASLKKQPVDVVLSDVMMPGMNGYALCQAIKASDTLKGIPVILLTAKADRTAKLEGLSTGADDYLFKPFDAKELRARISNLITNRHALTQQQRIVPWNASKAVPVRSVDAIFLERVREATEHHLTNSDFGVEWLASEVGASPRHLQRKLKALTKLSAASYIRMMRMKRAAHLLEQEVGTVAEVAYAVGFRDAKYFSTVFREHYQVLPSQWTKHISEAIVHDSSE